MIAPQTTTTAAGDNIVPGLDIVERVSFSPEQNKVLDMVVNRNMSVFFTGSAGTGKTVILKWIIQRLKEKFSGQDGAVVVTASTGLAARQIGGQTIHSFASFNDGSEQAEVLAGKIRKRFRVLSAWQKAKVLIIDEISMLDGAFFNRIADVASCLRTKPRERPEPFGGLQVVVTGDFFQLPPVRKTMFAFETSAWERIFNQSNSIELIKVFRQTDQQFVSLLEEMRFGRMTRHSIELLQSLQRPVQYNDGIDPVEM